MTDTCTIIHNSLPLTLVLYIIGYDWHKYYTLWGMTDTSTIHHRVWLTLVLCIIGYDWQWMTLDFL